MSTVDACVRATSSSAVAGENVPHISRISGNIAFPTQGSDYGHPQGRQAYCQDARSWGVRAVGTYTFCDAFSFFVSSWSFTYHVFNPVQVGRKPTHNQAIVLELSVSNVIFILKHNSRKKSSVFSKTLGSKTQERCSSPS